MPGKFEKDGLWHWTDGQNKPVTAADLRAKGLAGGTFTIGDPSSILDTGIKAGIATITAGGIRRIKAAPWRECGCQCHKTKHRVIHLRGKPCCALCPVCTKNIAGDLALHLKEAHPGSAGAPPVVSIPSIAPRVNNASRPVG